MWFELKLYNMIFGNRFCCNDENTPANRFRNMVRYYIKDTINTVIDEHIEDNDEYLKIKDTTTHVKINKKLN